MVLRAVTNNHGSGCGGRVPETPPRYEERLSHNLVSLTCPHMP
jgi:hypothetical protein